MKVYLAGRYSRRDLIAEVADLLSITGFQVTSRWLTGDHRMKPDDDQAEVNARFATEDLEDIDAAEAVLVFTEPSILDRDEPDGGNRGGRHVELGYAIAHPEKELIVCGPRENVFCWLPRPTVRHADTLAGALFILYKLQQVAAAKDQIHG